MKAVQPSKSRATTSRRFRFKKPCIAAAIPAPSHFNARHVIDDPVFTLARPAVDEGIYLTIQAHCLGDRQWIAEPVWGSRCGHLPHDGLKPHTGSTVYQSRSEAVEHAIDADLTKIREQLGALTQTPTWRKKVQAVESWAADAVAQTREHDETLALYGTTVIDLCSGGLGGFGLGLTSLGAEVVLAVEIDPQARHVSDPARIESGEQRGQRDALANQGGCEPKRLPGSHWLAD